MTSDDYSDDMLLLVRVRIGMYTDVLIQDILTADAVTINRVRADAKHCDIIFSGGIARMVLVYAEKSDVVKNIVRAVTQYYGGDITTYRLRDGSAIAKCVQTPCAQGSEDTLAQHAERVGLVKCIARIIYDYDGPITMSIWPVQTMRASL